MAKQEMSTLKDIWKKSWSSLQINDGQKMKIKNITLIWPTPKSGKKSGIYIVLDNGDGLTSILSLRGQPDVIFAKDGLSVTVKYKTSQSIHTFWA